MPYCFGNWIPYHATCRQSSGESRERLLTDKHQLPVLCSIGSRVSLEGKVA